MQKAFLALTAIITIASCNHKNVQKMNEMNISLVNQYFNYFNHHNWPKMAEMYAETAEFKDPSLGQGIVTQSREEIIQKYSDIQQVFADIKDEVIQVYPSGEQHVIVEFISSGTAPDGSKFELPICTIFTFENGKIVKDYTYYDNFEE